MAENILAWKYHFCSKYLLHKTCPRGTNCPYKHVDEHSVILNRTPTENIEYVVGRFKPQQSEGLPRRPNSYQKMPCVFYARGTCQFGTRCKYSHDMPPRSEQDSRNQRNSQSFWNASMPSTSTQTVLANSSGNKALDINKKARPSSSENGPTKEINRETLNLPHTITSGALLKSEEWVKAPEFIPKGLAKPKSYAEVLNPFMKDDEEDNSKRKLCSYAEGDGYCKYPPGECQYLHGDICDLCGRAALHPYNEEQRKKHTQECIKQHERDMELSFAVARSKEKSCGVCFEVIMEKTSGEQRFGILPNCNHCFCLGCIRKWRQARQFENKIIRACPECRVTSDFVCPSMYWVDTKEEKDKLIDDYKDALSKKDCKYFKQGRGKCPFGNKCFYLHALPDGTKTDVGPPPRQRRNFCNTGDIEVLQQIILWDYLEERDNNRWLYSLADDLEDLVAFFSDSDDSDWSDYEFFMD